MIINIAGVWDNAKSQHITYLRNVIDIAINQLEERNKTDCPGEVLTIKFLRKNKEQLLSDTPSQLIPVIEDFQTTFNAELLPIANGWLKTFFNYEKFSSITTHFNGEWSAFSLCSLAKWEKCPYCQLSFVDTRLPDKSTDIGYRPQLDHYFSKSEFPYLALSLGNLLPACEKCNGPYMKHGKDFYTDPHLHPLADEETIHFSVMADPPTRILTEPFDSVVNHAKIELSHEAHVVKAAASLSTFQLQHRYQQVLKEAVSMAIRCRGLEDRIKYLQQHLPSIPITVESELGFDPETESYKNTLLGKMYKDIYKDWT